MNIHNFCNYKQWFGVSPILVRLPFFVAIAISSVILCVAQTPHADSLKLILDAPYLTDKMRVDYLNDIAASTRNTNYDTAFRYAKIARTIAAKIGYAKGLAIAYREIAVTLSNKGLYQEAIDTILIELNIVRELNT
jgi:hypothetical protein